MFSGLHIIPPLSRYGVAVQPTIRIFGLIESSPAMSERYIPSPSGGIKWHSSMMHTSRLPISPALRKMDCTPPTTTSRSASHLSSPAEHTPTFKSGATRDIFSAFCSRSSFAPATTSARPPHVFTVSDAICPKTQLLPEPTGISTHGFVFFRRRWS